MSETTSLQHPAAFNVRDCYGWDGVKRVTIKTPFKTKEELKAPITTALIDLNKDIIGKACGKLRSHLEAMNEASRYFFE